MLNWPAIPATPTLLHVTAFRRGEEFDPETALPHVYHAVCGLMFLAWYAHGPNSEQYRKLDDRPFKEGPK